jgi:hypothetical protein
MEAARAHHGTALGIALGAMLVSGARGWHLETDDQPHECRDADGNVERSLDAFHSLID